MILQARDQELLRKLSKYEVLSTRQIASLSFPNVTHTTMMRRMRLLEKGKFIHRGVTLEDGTNTWILGLEGRKIMNVGPSSVFMNRNTIEHDVRVTEVRMTFESLGLAKEWTPEWKMKAAAMRNLGYRRRDTVIPDGLMIEFVNGESRVFAVELERTRKSTEKYKKLLYQYSDKSGIDVIWYIVREASIANAILGAGRATDFPMSRLWFSLEHELLTKKHSARVWQAQQGAWIAINHLGLNNLKPAQSPAQGVSKSEEEKTPPAA